MKSVVAVCVLFAICLTSINALSCYTCVYFEGHPASDAQCRRSPSSGSVAPCTMNTETPSTALSVRTGFYKRNESSEIVSTNGTESRQDLMILCTTFTASLDGRTIVARSCFLGFRELNGACTRDVYLEIDGRNATNVFGCFCGSDRCNSTSSATNIHFTYFAFIVIAMIHVMYKLL